MHLLCDEIRRIQQLHELYLKYQPDIIFIECSGVAEPLAVVDACFTPVLAPFITLRSMVGIIDASMYSRIKSYPQDIAALFYEQLRHCSTLFVNKIDKIEGGRNRPLATSTRASQ